MSATYPKIDEELDNVLVGFHDLDWDYYNVHGVIAELKDAVPKECRDYDPVTKRWAFEASYKVVILDILQRHFGQIR